MDKRMVFINGGSPNQRKYAYSMVEFVCQKFDIAPKIEINFRRMSTDENYGYCCELEDNEYEIDLKRTLRMRQLLITLAHEMVHVKQHELGERKNKSNNGDYWDCPYEIEAHGREVGLFIRWAEQENLSKKSWVREN